MQSGFGPVSLAGFGGSFLAIVSRKKRSSCLRFFRKRFFGAVSCDFLFLPLKGSLKHSLFKSERALMGVGSCNKMEYTLHSRRAVGVI